MTAFRIPKKLHVINSDNDARILNQAGAVYSDGDISGINGTEGFSIEGLSPNIFGNELVVISGTTRISKEVAVAPVTGIFAWTCPAAAAAGDVFRLVWESLNHEEVEMQNYYKEKQYQISAVQATADAVAINIAAVINADKNAPVVAYAGIDDSGGTTTVDSLGTVMLVPKDPAVEVRLYAEAFTLTAAAVGTEVAYATNTSFTTIAPTLGAGNYLTLKTQKYADPSGLNIDTEVKWNFQPGVQYHRYRFWSNKANQITTGGLVEPSTVTGQSQVEFEIFVRDGISLEAAMDVLAADVNV